jgi:hypothetical protein
MRRCESRMTQARRAEWQQARWRGMVMLPRDGDGKEEILSSRSHGRRTLARKIFFWTIGSIPLKDPNFRYILWIPHVIDSCGPTCKWDSNDMDLKWWSFNGMDPNFPFFHAVSIVHRFHNFVCIDPKFFWLLYSYILNRNLFKIGPKFVFRWVSKTRNIVETRWFRFDKENTGPYQSYL